jgi:hypothetical protein
MFSFLLLFSRLVVWLGVLTVKTIYCSINPIPHVRLRIRENMLLVFESLDVVVRKEHCLDSGACCGDVCYYFPVFHFKKNQPE